MEELNNNNNMNNNNESVFIQICKFFGGIIKGIIYLVILFCIYILAPIGLIGIGVISVLYSMDRNVKKSDIERIVKQNQVVVYESAPQMSYEEVYIEETLEDNIEESFSDEESTISDEELREQLKEELREEIRAEVEQEYKNELLEKESLKEELKTEILEELQNNSNVSDSN